MVNSKKKMKKIKKEVDFEKTLRFLERDAKPLMVRDIEISDSTVTKKITLKLFAYSYE